MFTGLIEAVGEVGDVKPLASGFQLRLASTLASDVRPGDSLSVNGVCLTVVACSDGEIRADVSPETARVTTLGSLKPGLPVNLERPLRADGRLGGHFVQGHADGIGRIEELRPDGECWWLSVSFPPPLARYIVHKGSIAVDGISLTVAGVGDRQFDAQIIPYTLAHTNLRSARRLDPVNIECDVLGKYVARVAELAGFGDPMARGSS